MIAGLLGSVYRTEPDALVVNVQGVLYRVFVPTQLLSVFSTGADVELHTHMVVREDAQQLYGFLTSADLQWFQTLIGVSGIGPRLGIAFLSRFGADELHTAISNEQVDVLTTVPGVGKKTAQRIILDLRGKLPEDLDASILQPVPATNDALEALIALGYSTAEAKSALANVADAQSLATEEQIVSALRSLSST